MPTSKSFVVGGLLAGVLGIAACGGGLSLLGLVAASANMNICIATGPDQQRETEFARMWRAPALGASALRLLPSSVNQWKLVSHDDAAKIAELAIDRDGLHASYESGEGVVEVFAYEVPATEQDVLFQTAENAIGSTGYKTLSSHRGGDTLSSRMVFSISPPNKRGWMWWSRGWLFVFITRDSSVDLGSFKSDFLSAIAAETAAEPAR